jgi:hypothetical protein
MWLPYAIKYDALECLFSVERFFNHDACRINWRTDRLWSYPCWISFRNEIKENNSRSNRWPSVAEVLVRVTGAGLTKAGPLPFCLIKIN